MSWNVPTPSPVDLSPRYFKRIVAANGAYREVALTAETYAHHPPVARSQRRRETRDGAPAGASVPEVSDEDRSMRARAVTLMDALVLEDLTDVNYHSLNSALKAALRERGIP